MVIRELFYSNGVDVFGPVDIAEFSKNKYYKSTLLWYEGLQGWVCIEDCKELKHLIGTMPADNTKNLPTKSLDITPNLSVKAKIKPDRNKFLSIFIFTGIVLLIITSYINYRLNKLSDENSTASTGFLTDTLALKEAAITETTRLETEMRTYRQNWDKFITTQPNDYRTREIGGIQDLKVIVNNNTPYRLDSMKVKVEYIRANEKVYQSEILKFENILANGNKELYAPNSRRGVSVNCTIIALYSEALEFCMQKKDKHPVEQGEDPYKCQ